MSFIPDYHNILDAANNKQSKRLALYEHNISDEKIEEITGKKFVHLLSGTPEDVNEYFRHYCNFFLQMGYDTVTYEACIGAALPFSGALSHNSEGCIKSREDFEKYPWDTVEDRYFEIFTPRFEALRANVPEGMKAIGGVGNGVFECVQELVGYEELCYMKYDDEELFTDLFTKMGDLVAGIWKRFLNEFGDIYCVCRFGDDLGFQSSTLLPTEDIKAHIFPQYKKVVRLVHAAGKPFLLHSCGCIFDVMDDLINDIGIDAKHSNEDAIAAFPVWVEKYGDKIGDFGGVDTDVLCQKSPEEIKKYVLNVIKQCEGHGGFALGSGNSIPDYVPASGYLAMVQTVREYRGDKQE